MNCKKSDRLQAEVDELWPFRKRAEKAEEERDEARANAYNWEATAEEWEKRAVRAESHPLTPDAITDEMVERGAIANWRGDVAHPDWTFEDISDEDRGWYRDNARAVLTAALTEPPARPEGAEDIEALIRDLLGSHPGDWYGDLADHLAAHLTDPTRKEA